MTLLFPLLLLWVAGWLIVANILAKKIVKTSNKQQQPPAHKWLTELGVRLFKHCKF